MSKQDSSRVPELDGLRGLAIALVVWCHLVEAYLPLGPSTWLGWVRAGTTLSWTGVDLFFVLSGYFIGGILIDQRESPRLSRVFYLRRALRILPLYFVTVLACFIMAAAGWPDAFAAFPAWIYGVFFTNFALVWLNHWDWAPLSVLWSLAVEEQFYLAAPWVVRALSPTRLPRLMAALIAVAWLLRLAAHLLFPDRELAGHVLMPMRMDNLALGVLLAWAVRNAAAKPFFQHLARSWPRWLAVCALLLLVLTVDQPKVGDPALVYGGYTVIALTSALVVAIVVGVRPAGLMRVLRSTPLLSLGRNSYFIYLWHSLIGVELIKWLGGPTFVLNRFSSLLIVLLAGGATWAASLVSGKFFETPLIALGHRHRY